jgi:hypothetical protein
MQIKLANILTAADLRQTMAEHDAEQMRLEAQARAHAQSSHRDFVQHFLHDHLTKRDVADLRTRIIAAAARGAYEAMIMRFPSSLCLDDGRAINNGEPQWPGTLTGKALEAYNLWDRVGRANGYRMIARIVDYPGGIPGDVGLFLNWSPPITA